MNGRPAKGILISLTNCIDPYQEDEYNSWYDEVHIPDVLRTGAFSRAVRYMNPHSRHGAIGPTYLTVYQTDAEDITAAWAENRARKSEWADGGRSHPARSLVRVSAYQYLPGASTSRRDTSSKGLVVALLDCADPDRQDEFNTWYDGPHRKAIMSTGVFDSAIRYRQPGSGGPGARYLTFYESKEPGKKAFKDLLGHFGGAPPRLHDLCKVETLWTFDHMKTIGGRE